MTRLSRPPGEAVRPPPKEPATIIRPFAAGEQKRYELFVPRVTHATRDRVWITLGYDGDEELSTEEITKRAIRALLSEWQPRPALYEAAHELYSACAEQKDARPSMTSPRVDVAMREFAEAHNRGT